jgi:ABC-type transport system substrate-binding protein
VAKVVVGVNVGHFATGAFEGFHDSDMPLFPGLANGHWWDVAVRRFVFSGVYRSNEAGEPVPDLAAEMCTWSKDLLDISCMLRPANFHDGTPLTAKDVAFAFELQASPACRERCVPVLRSVTAIGDHEVVFHLRTPDATFLTVALPDVLIEQRAVIEASYARFRAGVGDADPDLLKQEAGRITNAITSNDQECAATADEAEGRVLALGLQPWSRDEFAMGQDKAVEPCAYAEYLARVLADTADSLTLDGVDAIAAAYRALDYQDDVPVGSGPWKVRAVAPGRRLDLEAFDDFHFGRPATASLEVQLIRTREDAVAAARDASVDWLIQPFASQAPYLLVDGLEPGDDSLSLTTNDQPTWFAMFYNVRDGALFSDPRLREAVELCIDKDETVAAATRDLYRAIQSPILPTSWAFEKTLTAPARDVDAATKLIEGSGWRRSQGGVYTKDGRRLAADVLLTEKRPDRLQFLRLVEAQVRDCGMEIRPRPVPSDVMNTALYWPHHLPGTNVQWDIVMNGLIGFGPYDPGLEDSVLRTSDISSEDNEDGENIGGYSNPVVDQRLDEARSTYAIRDRARIYSEVQNIVAEDRPILFAWAVRQVEARSGRLRSTAGPLSGSSVTWWWRLEKLVLDQPEP